MRKNKKKFSWDRPFTWGDYRNLCIIGLIIGGIEIVATIVRYWWDDITTKFNDMRTRLTELELWKARKDRA